MHQSPRRIPLALSLNLISNEINLLNHYYKTIATTLLKYPKTDVDELKLPKVYIDSTLHGFINNNES